MSLKLLPVVKAYPVIDPVSQTEAVCVAGISMDAPHRWVRLFPLDYRGLVYAKRFKKYEVIDLDASKSTKDTRPESFTPVLDSITVGAFIGTDNGTWRRRLPYFDAVEDESMCEIQRRQKTERKSLGVFRPQDVTDLRVAAAEEGFAEAQRALLNQASLFGDRAGDDTRAALEQYCGLRHDTRFITGSMLKHPGSFLILGLVHPRTAERTQQATLF
jgi:hypothetical protein